MYSSLSERATCIMIINIATSEDFQWHISCTVAGIKLVVVADCAGSS